MQTYIDNSKSGSVSDQEGIPPQLPRLTVIRTARENFQPEFTFEKEVVNLMIECGTEFIKMLTSVSYEISDKGGMSTITPQHIVAALIELGYEEYVDEIQDIIDQAKDNYSQKTRGRQRNSIVLSGLSEEELLVRQEELFQSARVKFMLDQDVKADKIL